jgi:hypothetical protein
VAPTKRNKSLLKSLSSARLIRKFMWKIENLKK